MVEELLEKKNKTLAIRVREALAAEKKPTINFGYYTDGVVKIDPNLPEEFKEKIDKIKMIRTQEEYKQFKQILDKLHDEFDPRVEKVTEAYIGIIESILVDAAGRFNEAAKSFAGGQDEETD